MTHEIPSWPLAHIWKTKADLARDLGESSTTVTSWFAVGRRIPPARFPAIMAAAKKRDAALSWDELFAIGVEDAA
jgi:DNA-binding transcriptional regulator YdaS (Cro superfamily)